MNIGRDISHKAHLNATKLTRHHLKTDTSEIDNQAEENIRYCDLGNMLEFYLVFHSF